MKKDNSKVKTQWKRHKKRKADKMSKRKDRNNTSNTHIHPTSSTKFETLQHQIRNKFRNSAKTPFNPLHKTLPITVSENLPVVRLNQRINFKFKK